MPLLHPPLTPLHPPLRSHPIPIPISTLPILFPPPLFKFHRPPQRLPPLPPNVWRRILHFLLGYTTANHGGNRGRAALIPPPEGLVFHLPAVLPLLMHRPFSAFLPPLLANLDACAAGIGPIPRTARAWRARDPALLLRLIALDQPHTVRLPAYDASLPDVHWSVLAALTRVKHLEFVDTTRHQSVTTPAHKAVIFRNLLLQLQHLTIYQPSPFTISLLTPIKQLSLLHILPHALSQLSNFITHTSGIESLTLSFLPAPPETFQNFLHHLAASHAFLSTLTSLHLTPAPSTSPPQILNHIHNLLSVPRTGRLTHFSLLEQPEALSLFLPLLSPNTVIRLQLPNFLLHHHTTTYVHSHSLPLPPPLGAHFFRQSAIITAPNNHLDPQMPNLQVLQYYTTLAGCNLRELHLHTVQNTSSLVPTLLNILPHCPNITSLSLTTDILFYNPELLFRSLPNLQRLYLGRGVGSGYLKMLPQVLRVLNGVRWIKVEWGGGLGDVGKPVLEAIERYKSIGGVDFNGLDEIVAMRVRA